MFVITFIHFGYILISVNSVKLWKNLFEATFFSPTWATMSLWYFFATRTLTCNTLHIPPEEKKNIGNYCQLCSYFGSNGIEAVTGIYYVWYLVRKSAPLALHKNINSTGRSGACATMLLLTNNTDRNEKRYMIAICLKKLFQYNANFFRETKTWYVKFYTWFYASTPFSNKTRRKIKDFRTFYLRERCRRIESSIEFPPKNE